jgi:hypothetical protein
VDGPRSPTFIVQYDERAEILKRNGAEPDEIEQLLVYTENRSI